MHAEDSHIPVQQMLFMGYYICYNATCTGSSYAQIKTILNYSHTYHQRYLHFFAGLKLFFLCFNHSNTIFCSCVCLTWCFFACLFPDVLVSYWHRAIHQEISDFFNILEWVLVFLHGRVLPQLVMHREKERQTGKGTGEWEEKTRGVKNVARREQMKVMTQQAREKKNRLCFQWELHCTAQLINCLCFLFCQHRGRSSVWSHAPPLFSVLNLQNA